MDPESKGMGIARESPKTKKGGTMPVKVEKGGKAGTACIRVERAGLINGAYRGDWRGQKRSTNHEISAREAPFSRAKKKKLISLR